MKNIGIGILFSILAPIVIILVFYKQVKILGFVACIYIFDIFLAIFSGIITNNLFGFNAVACSIAFYLLSFVIMAIQLDVAPNLDDDEDEEDEFEVPND